MLAFWVVDQYAVVNVGDSGIVYRHTYDRITNPKDVRSNQVYFSTPSSYQQHLAALSESVGKEHVKLLDHRAIMQHPKFPRPLGRGNLADRIEPLLDRDKVRVGIVNAMSNALGDHLIGMRALAIWYDRVTQLIPPEKLEVVLYQLNPQRMLPITKQFEDKIADVQLIPNRLAALAQCDGYYDLGGLLLLPGFDNQPMIDFFLDILGVDKSAVPADEKRMHYTPSEQAARDADKVFRQLRAKGRPVLLVHHKSTAEIRSMPDSQAARLIDRMIEKTDYLVVSCLPIKYRHRRFVSLARQSGSFDHFAAIVGRCDGIVTVDTSTYHLADAFGVPTVALFTTIPPAHRVKYYPTVDGVMLESRDGPVYGRHKPDQDKTTAEEQVQYVANLWDRVSVDDTIARLEARKAAVRLYS